jgi:hypothetical protein
MLNTTYNYFRSNPSILPPNSPKYTPSYIDKSISTSHIVNYQANNEDHYNNNDSLGYKLRFHDFQPGSSYIKDIYLDQNTYKDHDNNSIDSAEISGDSFSESYSSKKSNILWSSETIMTLSILENKINSHKLMQPLGHIVKYYINKHQTNSNEYKIRLIDNISEPIDKNILILAYVCELKLQNSMNFDSVITDRMVYSSFGKIIYEVISDIFRYDSWELSFDENFLVNLLSDILPSSKTSKTREIITTSYYISKYIIKYIEQSRDNLINYMPSSIAITQEIKISIFNSEQIRDCLNVMGTKRRLYLRLLMSICGYMLHEDIDRIISLIFKNTEIINQSDFNNMLSDMMMEITITITGYIIKINGR